MGDVTRHARVVANEFLHLPFQGLYLLFEMMDAFLDYLQCRRSISGSTGETVRMVLQGRLLFDQLLAHSKKCSYTRYKRRGWDKGPQGEDPSDLKKDVNGVE